jgi:hypothetical protein
MYRGGYDYQPVCMVTNNKCILLLKCLEIIFSRFDDHERYLKPPAVGEVSEKNIEAGK